MENKGKSLTYFAIILLLLGYVVTTMATSMSYKMLKAQFKNTITVVERVKISLTTQHSINDSQITEGKTKWYFDVSDCWNYTLAEDERLSDNYIRLKTFKRHAIKLNIKSSLGNIVVEIGNLHRAIKRMRQKLGYPHVNTTKHHTRSFTTGSPQEQRILEVTFLSMFQDNLYLMLNDFEQRT